VFILQLHISVSSPPPSGQHLERRWKSNVFFFHGATVHSGPRSRHYRDFTITHTHTHTHTQYDLSGRVISPTQDLYVTKHSKKRDIHDLDGIRTHNTSKRAAADPRLGVCTVRITLGDLRL